MMNSTSWQEFRQKAARHPQRIVLAEGDDLRVVKAAHVLQKEKIAQPWLVGSRKKIETLWKQIGGGAFDVSCIDWDALSSPEKKVWAEEWRTLPKNKTQS